MNSYALVPDDEDLFREVIGAENKAERWDYVTCPKCGSRKFAVMITNSGPISDSSGAIGSWWEGLGKCHDCFHTAPYTDQSF